MTDWEVIRKEWETTDISLKELANKNEVSESTVRSRKNREKWQRNETKKNATQRKNVATAKKDAKPKKSTRYPNGHPGNKNPENQFTKRNQAAKTHGLFSKYLPEETLAIIEAMNEKTPADLLFDQIQIQYAAIIRAQQIMHVESKDELVKELKREKHQSGEKGNAWEEEYEIQFAWDRQAQLLQAQSRAITELRSSINQFIKLADEEDERRLKLEQMQLSIDKTKIEIEKISEGEQNNAIEIQIVSKKAD